VSSLPREPKARRRTAAFCSALLAAALLPTAGSAQNLHDVRVPDSPLVLKQQGSFFVGGKQVHSDAAGWDQANALPQYGAGDITVNQMYVQFQIPVRQRHPVPLVFVHGCCLSSKTWETTPDGRMGWYEYFTRRGFATYLGEQAGRARSGFDGTVFNQVRSGALPPSAQPPVLLGTAQFAWDVFRFGPTFGTAWPDEQFPMYKVKQLYKQVIPDLILTLVPDLFAELGDPGDRLPTVREMASLAKDLGGAVLIGHSQSSGYPTKAALHDPSGVRGIIGLETGCFGNLDRSQIATLSKIPILIVVGDHFGEQPPASCVTERQQINDAGGDMTFISLPDLGIHGNSHMFMQDNNNLQIADVIIKWIRTDVGVRPPRT
jgi:hypothetical protein